LVLSNTCSEAAFAAPETDRGDRGCVPVVVDVARHLAPLAVAQSLRLCRLLLLGLSNSGMLVLHTVSKIPVNFWPAPGNAGLSISKDRRRPFSFPG